VQARTGGVPPPHDGCFALSLFFIINLGFFAMGGDGDGDGDGDGSDIIVVVGFSWSYDSGLCCFIGSIIPWGSSPLESTVGKN